MSMGIIELRGLRCKAYHGCLPEEAVIGTDYVVNLSIRADLSASMASDKLSDTVDYVLLHDIVRSELLERSQLIERVAARIAARLFREEPKIEWLRMEVRKKNPPIGGEIDDVAVIIEESRPL